MINTSIRSPYLPQLAAPPHSSGSPTPPTVTVPAPPAPKQSNVGKVMVGLGLTSIGSLIGPAWVSQFATNISTVQERHLPTEPPADTAKNQSGTEWTVFRVTYYSSDLDQNVYDGLQEKDGATLHLSSALINEKGEVPREYFAAGGKFQKRDLPPQRTHLADYLREEAKLHPARHYMIVFSGHSHLLRPVLEPIEQGMRESGLHFDVLHFDSCSMAEADIASQFKGDAHYMVASQAYGMGNEYMSALQQQAAVNPGAVSTERGMANVVARMKLQQRTSTVIDLRRMQAVDTAVTEFGKQVRAIDRADLPAFKNVVHETQRFARITPWDNSPAVDIVDLAAHLDKSPQLSQKYPQLVASADQLSSSVRGAVTDEYYRAGHGMYTTMQFLYENVQRPGGMTVLLPTGDSIMESYLYNGNLGFWKGTGWDKTMAYVSPTR